MSLFFFSARDSQPCQFQVGPNCSVPCQFLPRSVLVSAMSICTGLICTASNFSSFATLGPFHAREDRWSDSRVATGIDGLVSADLPDSRLQIPPHACLRSRSPSPIARLTRALLTHTHTHTHTLTHTHTYAYTSLLKTELRQVLSCAEHSRKLRVQRGKPRCQPCRQPPVLPLSDAFACTPGARAQALQALRAAHGHLPSSSEHRPLLVYIPQCSYV